MSKRKQNFVQQKQSNPSVIGRFIKRTGNWFKKSKPHEIIGVLGTILGLAVALITAYVVTITTAQSRLEDQKKQLDAEKTSFATERENATRLKLENQDLNNRLAIAEKAKKDADAKSTTYKRYADDRQANESLDALTEDSKNETGNDYYVYASFNDKAYHNEFRGVTAWIEYRNLDRSKRVSISSPKTPHLISIILGLDDIQMVEIRDIKLGAEDLKRIFSIKTLRVLILDNCTIDNSTIADLPLSPELQYLNLCNNAISTIPNNWRLNTVQAINLDGNAIGSRGLESLGKHFPRLKSISADATVCDEGALLSLMAIDGFNLITVKKFDVTDGGWAIVLKRIDERNARKQNLQLEAREMDSVPKAVRKRIGEQFEGSRMRANDRP